MPYSTGLPGAAVFIPHPPYDQRAIERRLAERGVGSSLSELGAVQPDKLVSLSEALYEAGWANLLGDEGEEKALESLIRKNTIDLLAKYTLPGSFANLIGSIFFAISFVGFQYVANFYLYDDELRIKIHHANKVHTFCQSFAFLGSSLVAFTVGLGAIITFCCRRRSENRRIKSQMKEFLSVKSKLIEDHNRRYIFCALTEVIFELRMIKYITSLFSGDPLSTDVV